jgi:hypothetical protein
MFLEALMNWCLVLALEQMRLSNEILSLSAHIIIIIIIIWNHTFFKLCFIISFCCTQYMSIYIYIYTYSLAA